MNAVLGHAGNVSASELASAWEAPVLPLGVAAVTVLLFVQAFVRLRRRGRADHAGAGRALLFGLALAIALLALVSPIDEIGERYLLSVHMLQHVLLADLAPALALVAVRGPLVFFLLPGFLLGPLARSQRLRGALSLLLRPRFTFAIWIVAYAAWHVPGAYDYALDHRLVHDLEHTSFLVAGVLVWTVLVDPARRQDSRISHRLALAAAIFAAGQALSYVLILTFTPLYPAYEAQHHRLLGLSALTDQHLAGLVMMVEQLLTVGTCAVFLLRAHARVRSGQERVVARTQP
jgi:putative membrane protein